MGKEVKTNAMRILDKAKIKYEMNMYECDEFIDGIQVADMNNQAYDESYKTLVSVGKSGAYYVFVLPVDKELDFKKCAKIVGEKSIELIPVKDITKVTGYVRGGTTSIGMKKNYPTIIYEGALQKEKIIISAGRKGEQIILSPEDLAKVVNGRFENFISQ